jgi:arginyl-tRNA--protein-N-Asp/Glu arginylyltransferase
VQVLDTFTDTDESCVYLPGRPSRLEYLVVLQLNPEEYEAAMNRGYRKFGPLLFRTVCEGCRECRSIRIPAEELRAVVLNDITPTVVSGVYHYHDPDLADRSLGTFALLQTLELAKHMGKPWAYFGYYVADCASLSYKARFRPCELLGDDGTWKPLVD